ALVASDDPELTRHHPSGGSGEIQGTGTRGFDIDAGALHDRDEVLELHQRTMQPIGVPRGDQGDVAHDDVREELLVARASPPAVRRCVVVLVKANALRGVSAAEADRAAVRILSGGTEASAGAVLGDAHIYRCDAAGRLGRGGHETCESKGS